MAILTIITVSALCLCLYHYLHKDSDSNENKKVNVRSTLEPEVSQTCDQEDSQDTPDYSIYTENYNYKRAMELIGQNEQKEAFEYLKKAIDDDENNGYAHAWIGRLYYDCGNYSMSLKAINNAISLLPGINQEPFFTLRSRIHRYLGDDEDWRDDAEKASGFDPSATEPYEELSDYYFGKQMYDESDMQMDKFIEIEPHNPYGYMVKGRNQLMRGNLDDAISLFEYASKLDNSYGAAYSFIADARMQQGNLSEAVENEIRALSIMIKDHGEDQKAIYVRNELAIKAYPLFIIKLKAQMEKADDKGPWYGMMGVVHSAARHYVEGASCYHELYKLEHDTADLVFEAYCWQKYGDFRKTAMLLEQAVAENPENMEYRERLMLAKAELGQLENALSVGEEILQKEPDNAIVHYNSGRIKQMLGQYSSAIENFDTVLVLSEEKNAFALLYRGIAKASIGDTEGSVEDFQRIVLNPDMTGYGLNVCQAKLLLTKYDALFLSSDPLDDEAFISLNSHIEETLGKIKEDPSSIDDAIEVLIARISAYSRMGRIEDSLNDMRTILTLGGRRFFKYRHSYEFEALRNLPEYEALLSEYETDFENAVEQHSSASDGDSRLEDDTKETISIPFTKEGSLCKVPCVINSLPLHFVFDTGASDVSMSSVEATFMLKNGYLRQQDISGKEYYMTASGEISEGTTVKLREVNFGGVKLNNVKASIVRNQKAPLLLGQTVLRHLGKIEIDNDNNTINVSR